MSTPKVLRHSDLEVASTANSYKGPSSTASLHSQQVYPSVACSPYHDYSLGKQMIGPKNPDKTTSNRMCGVTFKMLLILVALVVIAFGVGLGTGIVTGASMQRGKQTITTSIAPSTVTQTQRQTQIQTQTMTVTISTSAAVSTAVATSNFRPSTLVDAVIPTNGTVALGCPAINGTNLRIALGADISLFSVTCGTDILDPSQDILAVISYSLSACAEACASYNRNYGQGKCVAATFNRDLTAVVGLYYGTCWLKNGTSGTTPSSSNTYAGLRLQSP